MGLFDRLTKKDPTATLKKHAARVADKRSMGPDRWESIQWLLKVESEESTEAMLARFTYHADPSITDQEEKEMIFNAVIARGPSAVPAVKRFFAKAEVLSWPLKMLDQLTTGDEVLAMLLELLTTMDTEYSRDPQRKLQLLAELEARRGARVVDVVLPFLRDVNETARFHAVGAILAQENAEQAKDAMRTAFAAEESVRVKSRIAEAFAQRGWGHPGK